MARSSDIYTKIDPEVKEKAEQILSSLGIPVANAINLFLHQVILQQGIPFEIKLPKGKMIDYSLLSTEQFDAEIEKGFKSINEGKFLSSSQVRENIERQYKV